jgi:hypothetical protein
MSRPLRERAAERGQPNSRPRDPQPAPPADKPAPLVAEYTDPIEPDPEQVPVHVAWARVMRDVRAIAKSSQFISNQARYNFRGVEDVDAAISNAVRRHGVMILPIDLRTEYARFTTKNNTAMKECTLQATFRIIGPKGDDLIVVSAGEAADTGDKSTTKALSIARRNAVIAALTVPTGAPEPEAADFERGHTVIPPVVYRDEITHPDTSTARLMQIRREFRDSPQTAGAMVSSPIGDVTLADLLTHVGRARQEGRDPFPDPPPQQPTGEPWPEPTKPGGGL